MKCKDRLYENNCRNPWSIQINVVVLQINYIGGVFMLRTSQVEASRVIPYWNEIKKWNQEEKLKLIALISESLVSENLDKDSHEESFEDQLSPELMKGLAKYAIKEHRAGHCITSEQVENSIMEAMGWK